MTELMNGVQVLSERTVNCGGDIEFGLVILILAAIMLIVTILLLKDLNPSGIITGAAFGFFTFFGVLIISEPPSQYIEYKVIINDNITYKEFTNKFEVISQEGKIYTVKLKESEE